MLTGQAAADMHDRRGFEDGPTVVTPAVAAWHEDGTDDRQSDLATMDVAGQHQIEMVFPGPAYVVGRVAQQQSKHLLWAAAQVRRRLEPRAFVAGDEHGLAADVDFLPTIAEHMQVDAAKPAANE